MFSQNFRDFSAFYCEPRRLCRLPMMKGLEQVTTPAHPPITCRLPSMGLQASLKPPTLTHRQERGDNERHSWVQLGRSQAVVAGDAKPAALQNPAQKYCSWISSLNAFINTILHVLSYSKIITKWLLSGYDWIDSCYPPIIGCSKKKKKNFYILCSFLCRYQQYWKNSDWKTLPWQHDFWAFVPITIIKRCESLTLRAT